MGQTLCDWMLFSVVAICLFSDAKSQRWQACQNQTLEYLISPAKNMTWPEANAYCLRFGHGAHLVTPRNGQQKQCIEKQSEGKQVWVGVQKQGGRLFYADKNETLTFREYADIGLPERILKLNPWCLISSINIGLQKTWAAAQCEHRGHFALCQRPVEISQQWQTCQGQKFEYLLSRMKKMTWPEANEYCSRFGYGAHLATPRNRQQRQCIQKERQDMPVWIGVQKIRGRTFYVDRNETLKSNDDQFFLPEQAATVEYWCLISWTNRQRNEKTWGIAFCQNKDYFALCQRPAWTNCSNLEVAYNIINEKKPWTEAKRSCEEIGGKLATPRNAEENQCVNQVSNGQTAWIGFYMNSQKNVFYADNGRQMLDEDYSNWWQPFTSPEEDSCVAASTFTFLYVSWTQFWKSKQCWTLTKSICQLSTSCTRLDSIQQSAGTVVQRTALEIRTVHVTCNAGFWLQEEKSHLTCNLSGQWTPTPEQCQPIMCPGRTDESFSLQKTSLQVEDMVLMEYKCSKGFYLGSRLQEIILGHGPELVCFLKEMTHYVPSSPLQVPDFPWPKCLPVHCLNPTQIQFLNGEVTFTGLTYGSTVTYACDPGYKLAEGIRSVGYCTENGTWSTPTPLCEACPLNGWRENCTKRCLCHQNASCQPKTRVCDCSSVIGYSGTTCNRKCAPGKFGRGCMSNCNCTEGYSCHHKTGECLCIINDTNSETCLKKPHWSTTGDTSKTMLIAIIGIAGATIAVTVICLIRKIRKRQSLNKNLIDPSVNIELRSCTSGRPTAVHPNNNDYLTPQPSSSNYSDPDRLTVKNEYDTLKVGQVSNSLVPPEAQEAPYLNMQTLHHQVKHLHKQSINTIQCCQKKAHNAQAASSEISDQVQAVDRVNNPDEQMQGIDGTICPSEYSLPLDNVLVSGSSQSHKYATSSSEHDHYNHLHGNLREDVNSPKLTSASKDIHGHVTSSEGDYALPIDQMCPCTSKDCSPRDETSVSGGDVYNRLKHSSIKKTGDGSLPEVHHDKPKTFAQFATILSDNACEFEDKVMSHPITISDDIGGAEQASINDTTQGLASISAMGSGDEYDFPIDNGLVSCSPKDGTELKSGDLANCGEPVHEQEHYAHLDRSYG